MIVRPNRGRFSEQNKIGSRHRRAVLRIENIGLEHMDHAAACSFLAAGDPSMTHGLEIFVLLTLAVANGKGNDVAAHAHRLLGMDRICGSEPVRIHGGLPLLYIAIE